MNAAQKRFIENFSKNYTRLGYSKVTFLEGNLFQVYKYANNYNTYIGYSETYDRGRLYYGLWDGTDHGFHFLRFIENNLFKVFNKSTKRLEYGVLVDKSYHMLPEEERLIYLYPYYTIDSIYKSVYKFYTELYTSQTMAIAGNVGGSIGANVGYVFNHNDYEVPVSKKQKPSFLTIFQFLIPKSCREEFMTDINEMTLDLREMGASKFQKNSAIALHLISVIYHGLFFKLSRYFYDDDSKDDDKNEEEEEKNDNEKN